MVLICQIQKVPLSSISETDVHESVGGQHKKQSPPGSFQVFQYFAYYMVLKLLQLGLPAFSIKFPHFSLGGQWAAALYGNTELIPLHNTLVSSESPPSLPSLEVGLSLSGDVEFSAPDWKVRLSPDFHVASPKLYKGDGVHLLRGDDGETGFSFDKKSARHFFVFAKAPASPKLQLRLEVRNCLCN